MGGEGPSLCGVGVFHVREVDICAPLLLTWRVLAHYTSEVWSC